MSEKLKEFKQERFEVIAGVFNPSTKEWVILSAADVSFKDEIKHEILQVKGKKLNNEYELLGFKPREGKVTWITLGKGSRERIVKSLCKEIRSLVEVGKTTWDLREVEEEKKPVAVELPEGLSTVVFDMHADVDAKIVHTLFDGILDGRYEFKSATNFGKMVSTVMYEKGFKGGTRMRMVTKGEKIAWSLQQTIDWAYRKEIKVIAVRRIDNAVEVAYIRTGVPEPPEKEKYIMFLKKTDGWKYVKEPKR